MSLSNKALDRIETWTSRLRGRQLGLPSIDGRMSVGESELAVEAVPRHRHVSEKSTATMQYENL